MKTEVKTPLLATIVVLLVVGLAFIGWKALSGVGSLDHGQVPYTPGVPPFKETDPAKRGPGGAPASVASGPKANVSPMAQAPNMQGAVGPPVVDNSKK